MNIMDSILSDYTELLASDNLKDAIVAQKICIFIGAGVAKNIGMPDWLELANKIAALCFKHKILTHSDYHTLMQLADPLKIISYCTKNIENHAKEKLLNRYLSEIFIENPQIQYENNRTLYNYFKELYESKNVLLIQTNYDHIIENCIKTASLSIQPYIPFSDDANTDINNDLLVYLHGKYENNYNDIVLTKNKYNEVYVVNNETNQQEKQTNFFMKLLKSYTIIMLGYSLQDNEIVQLIAQRKQVESYKTINIIIDTCNAKKISNEIDAEYWKSCCNGNINIYTYDTEEDGFSKFSEVLEKIKNTICAKPNQDILEYIDPKNIEDLDNEV